MAKDPVVLDLVGTADAMVSFPAEDAEDAANKVRAWVLHPGCQMSLTFRQTSRAIETDEDGVPGLVEPPPEPEPLEGE